ncbi:unnamed protein product [Rotaria sp. Silwood2]|nr:unnamed protein product [Rotaria sp. Silwood2]CAF3075777.1 unnamed protein product [Rotaria sp. Silwood2]CAF3330736.1 unnamed protein product [Rotaria sp. Silwood2]CAF4332823.1 unnamed protein product [Rotaria sp. Silwood2]CAF4340092.1 unnamed protein product [Rotaria sp. Silwood2]
MSSIFHPAPSLSIILFTTTLVVWYINNNVAVRIIDAHGSKIIDPTLRAFMRKLTGGDQQKANSSIQGCFFGGYDFSFLNRNNGSDYIGVDVGVITNTYKMNICGPVNDDVCQYSWKIPTSVCYICTKGNPHILGHVTLIGSFGADGAGVAWNFINYSKPELGVTMTYINGENPCFCPSGHQCLPATIIALQCADETENTFSIFVDTNTCITYLYLNIKCPN